MKTQLLLAGSVLSMSSALHGALVVGQTVGIDFGATAPNVAGTTWNQLQAGTTTVGTTTLSSPETFTIGNLSDTSSSATGSSFTLTNYTRYNAWDFGNGSVGDGGLINDASVWGDGLLSNDASARNTSALQDYFELTFSGLDDDLTYDFVGGYARGGNDNFNGVWFANGVVTGGAGGTIDATQGTQFITDAQNAPTSDDYATFTGLSTDGSGNLTILLTGEANNPNGGSNSGGNSGANQVIVAAVTLTAVPEPSIALLSALAGLAFLRRRR